MFDTHFRLNTAMDAQALHRRFRASGRIHIPNFLAGDGAERLYDELRNSSAWTLVINQEETLFELDRDAQATLTDEQRTQLDQAVYRSARTGFQYRYETIRVADASAERRVVRTLLNGFAEFLSSEPIVRFLRTVTGAEQINFADAQATAYGPGHFLTAHDDAVAGKNRVAAYVFNLTRDWRPDWGGLLAFHGEDGHIKQAYSPRFNALNIFTVPQPHSVSYVVPYVPYRRYAVTGWLRKGKPQP